MYAYLHSSCLAALLIASAASTGCHQSEARADREPNRATEMPSVKLALTVDGTPWKMLRAPDLARAGARPAPQGVATARLLGEVLEQAGAGDVKYAAVYGTNAPDPVKLGGSLFQDSSSQPMLFTMPDGSLAVGADAGRMAARASWVYGVTRVDLVGTRVVVRRRGRHKRKSRVMIRDLVRDKRRELSGEELRRLASTPFKRNGRDAKGVPLGSLVELKDGEHVSIVSDTSKRRLSSVEDAYLYVNRRGSVHLELFAAKDGATATATRRGNGDGSGAHRAGGGDGSGDSANEMRNITKIEVLR